MLQFGLYAYSDAESFAFALKGLRLIGYLNQLYSRIRIPTVTKVPRR
jgi:hypothetical protein